MRGLFLFLIIALPLSAQELQIKKVYDFSGGLVNSISNAAMQDNMAKVLENYDIDPFGNLKRRPGLRSYGGSSLARIYGIFPYLRPDEREVYLLMNQSSDSTRLVSCDFATGLCTTTVLRNYYYPKDWKVPYNIDYFMRGDNLYFSQTGAELTVYDGEKFWPIRPRAAGQAKVLPLNGFYHVNGIFRYKYCYVYNSTDTSNFSVPTWPVYVNYGRVYISDLWAPVDTTADSIMIYREQDFSGIYEHLITLDTSARTYLDTFTVAASGDTLDYRWGNNYHCSGGSGTSYATPPGAMIVTKDDIVSGDPILHDITSCIWDIPPYDWACLAYAVVFVDSSGRHSYMSPPACACVPCEVEDAEFDVRYHNDLTDIPVPHDSNIVHKLLLRMHAQDRYAPLPQTDSNWYNRYAVIDTLDPDSTTYTDSIGFSDYKTKPVYMASSGTGYCVGRDPADTLTSDGDTIPWATFVSYDSIGDIQEFACYDDSNIGFTPIAMWYSGNRIYATGDPEFPTRLYFSATGNISAWPTVNFLDLNMPQGDWIVKLFQVDANSTIIFAQFSCWRFTGRTFYQYQLSPISNYVGLSASRTVTRIGSDIYFYHSTGVYQLPIYGSISDIPVSFSIQNSLDSFMINQQRATAANIGGEYWLSLDFASGIQQTYIYSKTPIPHWKSYDFGFYAAVSFDVDTLSGQFNPNRWLLALTTQKGAGGYLYQFRTDSLDTMDVYKNDAGDTFLYKIYATYQSKRFFEGREREKIFWLDIVGQGTASTITLTFYDEETPFDTVVFLPDFTDEKRDRIVVDHIVTDFSVRWQDDGKGQYRIEGYEIGWIPWSGGRPTP